MDSKEISVAIWRMLKTVEERAVFLDQLDIFQEQLFRHTEGKVFLVKFQKFFEGISELADNKLVGEIRIAVIGMRVVDLVIAFEPRVGDLDKISAWLKQNISENSLLSYRIDPGIIGGVKIDHDGKYVDMSIRNKLAGYWQLEGEKIFKQIGIGL